ncbi:MAG: methyltransferase domain-containing protein [Bacteroidales bacterium]|nr:methyltransferase domain-containing protein [Bacteroidales bacterium]
MKNVIKIKNYIKNNYLNEKSFKLNELSDYFSGSKFSNYLYFKFPKQKKVISRDAFVIDLVKNKNNIHIGCVDHNPEIIKQKIDEENYFHKKLVDNSRFCMGVDINAEGVIYMKNILKYKNVYCVDIIEGPFNKITEAKFDFMILGEVIEHVDNPCYFLKKINNYYKKNIKKIVITTPNSFSYRNIKNANKGMEGINSDHKSQFSPYTLSKILYLAGFRNLEINFSNPCDSFIQKCINIFFNRKIFYKKSSLSETLIITADFE